VNWRTGEPANYLVASGFSRKDTAVAATYSAPHASFRLKAEATSPLTGELETR
jgi:hypothetical protein